LLVEQLLPNQQHHPVIFCLAVDVDICEVGVLLNDAWKGASKLGGWHPGPLLLEDMYLLLPLQQPEFQFVLHPAVLPDIPQYDEKSLDPVGPQRWQMWDTRGCFG
jgi:hypothetical protein